MHPKGDSAGPDGRNSIPTSAESRAKDGEAAPTSDSPAGGSSVRNEPGSLSMEDIRRLGKRLGPAGPLALISATLPAIGGFVLLGSLKLIGPWLREHADVGVGLYIAIYALSSGLAILPTYAQSFLGGWAFGFAHGTMAATGGLVGGAVVGYLVARRAAGQRVVTLIAEQPKWKAVYDTLLRGGFWKTLAIVTLVRLPSSPFAVTNLILAATRVGFAPYVIGTVVGILPRTAVAVYLAASASKLDFSEGSARWFWIAGVVAAVAIAGLIGYWANQAIARVTAADAPQTPVASAGSAGESQA